MTNNYCSFEIPFLLHFLTILSHLSAQTEPQTITHKLFNTLIFNRVIKKEPSTIQLLLN